MTTKRAGRQFFDALNKRDFQLMASLLDPEVEMFFPKTAPLRGRERTLKFIRLLFRKYPQLDFSVQRVIAQGELTAVHWTNRGRSRKDEAYENEGVTLIELSGSRIRFISDFFKDTEKF